MATLTSRNPYTNEVLETFPAISDAELEAVLAKAAMASANAKKDSISNRHTRLRSLARAIRKRSEELARTAVLEMGKTYVAAKAEVEKCAMTSDWYAERLPELLADIEIQKQPYRQFIRGRPLGTVLAVMPWNFPFWQAFRAAIPALGAGNTMILKHASNVSRCALLIEEMFRDAGFENGAFQTVLLESSRVARVIADARIHAATLTGSEAAGRSIAAEAGRHLKKCVLELGGSDPFVVLPSADVKKAAEFAAQARLMNNGQSCIAAKRFIIHADIFESFTETFTAKMRAIRAGDPLEETTELGPLVHTEAVHTLAEQVTRAKQAGATALLEPEIIEKQNLFRPAVLSVPESATPRSLDPIFREEMFGPVALVFRARSLDHAIELANASPFGLGSSIWTKNEEETQRAIDEFEAGLTFINKVVASEPQLPFGGVKASGYGRELGLLGLREFMNLKSVSFGSGPAGD